MDRYIMLTSHRQGRAFALAFLVAGTLLALASAAFGEGTGPPSRPALTSTSEPSPRVDEESARKIEPDLLRAAMGSRAPLRFIVYLRERADLADAAAQAISAPPGPQATLARRRAVVAALQRKAETSQAPLRAALAAAQAAGHVHDYTPFWVVNAIAVTADSATLLEVAARPEVAIVRADHEQYLPQPLAEIGKVFSDIPSPLTPALSP
ncbi:MAG: protease inhibitor I9 family protein, partial [Anaerolineae bacterium]|nr:protease inhibitor I9 family protein [Anaerolineae bacterium]